MYKIFRRFPLVEAYQDLKKAKRLAESQAVARCIKLVIAITIPYGCFQLKHLA